LSELLVAAAAPGGTAPEARIPGYEVAGKTGTTQKIVDGRYSRQHHVASFSGYFPASNPRVVITVIVDEPNSAGPSYGGLVAAPSFRRVGVELIPYLGIEAVRSDAVLAQREGGFR
jgi:cell division protein FtsI/penicillin-binding protein 2